MLKREAEQNAPHLFAPLVRPTLMDGLVKLPPDGLFKRLRHAAVKFSCRPLKIVEVARRRKCRA